MSSAQSSVPRPPLVLGSSSRYRRELLERLRIPFEVASPDIDETPLAGEAPHETALRLSRRKAEAIAARHPGALVIGSDQVATLDGAQIGKPGSHDRALAQLQLMRGRTVIFHSALCLLDSRDGRAQTADVQTRVTFRDLPDSELQAYLHAEQPYDVAGSAKSEGLGIALLSRVESDDPTALVGLPLIALTTMLRQAGYPLYAS
ncbi:Maf-like protein [Cupriavidus respiraculi]|uniref:Maf-like protein n=1 Tax=Cupriavidus respiraculi TaxID=195930 RepID=UPI001C959AD3|nr:Maf-like protein [Cupriavidus respiraculi]MBY4947095.1 Maf-like protein [Cupriavidus respiraculi]